MAGGRCGDGLLGGDGKDGAPPETKCREDARGRKRRKEGKSAGKLPEFSAFTMNVGHE